MMLRRMASGLLAGVSLITLLTACSPQYNWREAHNEGQDANLPFTVLLPAKPATFTRPIDLDGIALTMNMTAAEVAGVNFAVGAAQLQDATQVPHALAAMRTALLRNIGGVPQNTPIPASGVQTGNVLDVVADGSTRGQPVRLMARLLARDERIYQVLIIGPANDVSNEQAEMFFTSFKPG